MRRIFIVLALIALFAWDYASNNAGVFAMLNSYVDQMVRYFFHFA